MILLSCFLVSGPLGVTVSGSVLGLTPTGLWDRVVPSIQPVFSVMPLSSSSLNPCLHSRFLSKGQPSSWLSYLLLPGLSSLLCPSRVFPWHTWLRSDDCGAVVFVALALQLRSIHVGRARVKATQRTAVEVHSNSDFHGLPTVFRVTTCNPLFLVQCCWL